MKAICTMALMNAGANFFMNKANNDSKFQKDQELFHGLFHVAII